MNNRVFITSDPHFSHRKIIEFEAKYRPFKTIEEHDETLVSNWNSEVKPNDTVICLGDVGFGKDFFKYLARLNGIKKLVMGNHDHYPIQRYLEYFTKVAGAMEYANCILTHIPVHPAQFTRYKANIHGHTHSTRVMLPNSEKLENLRPGKDTTGIPDERYICVSMEHTGLKPVLLNEILNKLK